VLARRQLDEQRRFLNEQDEIGRHQVRVTEQSLSEQNERARLSLAFDLIMRLRDCFDSPGFLRSRREAAKFLLDNAFVEDAAEAPSLATNSAAMTVCNTGMMTPTASPMATPRGTDRRVIRHSEEWVRCGAKGRSRR